MSKNYETEMLAITAIVGGLTLYGLYKIGQTATTAQQQAASAEQGIQNQLSQFQQSVQPAVNNANSFSADPIGYLWNDVKHFFGGGSQAPAGTVGTGTTGGTS